MLKPTFRTKVLVPVIAVMALLVAVSMWLVNRRVTEQIRVNAAEQLKTAEAVLKVTQQNRESELLLRYRNVVNEPRVKAWATAEMFSSGRREIDPQLANTLLNFLHYLVQEGLCDTVVLTPVAGQPLVVTRDPQFNVKSFEVACTRSVKRAFQNQYSVEIVQNDDRLFDVVTFPILIGNTNAVVGAVTFGVQNALAQDFLKLTQSELTLFSGGRPVASTFRNAEIFGLMPAQFRRVIQDGSDQEVVQVVLGEDHFLCSAGWLGPREGLGDVGYLVLSSYEKPLMVLRSTQQMIFLTGLAAVLLGATVVWFLIKKIMRPLQELHDSVEAVGRGDFSRRVPVDSRDECGELAIAFNHMTEKIQTSRAELEQTVTTLKTTQEQLIQSEKLSAVGEFVAGVAHELNNPLAAVTGFSEMLKDADVGPQHRRHLELIHKAAQRCQKIVKSLLSFARRQKPERKPVSVNALVESVLEMIAYPLRTNNVEVTIQLDPALPFVLADGHQIQQVLLNVLNNARQAIETHESGKIKIVTTACEPNVRITIQDNGPGITPENLRRIFDPFFTTKEIGKGTGLGLSLCYGMIKEHGGNIFPLSKPGEGATFIIELPIAHGVDVAKPSPRPAADALAPEEGRGKRILIVDDEEMLLGMMREQLNRYGYEVVTVLDGETALREIGKEHFDAAFFDWKMPGLNGRQLYGRLREVAPSFCRRVVFITGDVVNEKMRKFLEEEGRLCLAKPFATTELRNAIKTVAAAP